MNVFGAAIALAGMEKLVRERGYLRMFEHLGWSKRAMRSLAAAETIGGTLMCFKRSRRFGGALVAGASAVLLLSELRHDDRALAVPRAAVLLTGLTALVKSND